MNSSINVKLNDSIPTSNHNTYFALTRNLVGIWELLLFLIGSFLNFIVLRLVSLLTRDKTRNNNHWLVGSMASADFLFTLIHSPLMFANYSLNLNFNAPACFTLYVTTYTTTTISSLSMLLLNVDKFVYLHKPLHYFMILTKPRIITAIIVAWLMAFVWALVFLFGPFTTYKPPCDFRPSNLNMYIFFAVFFFTLPIILSLIISVYVAAIVVKAKKEKQIRDALHSTRRRNSKIKVDNNFGTINQLKAITFVFTTTIWSSISCLPYRIAYAVYVSPGFVSSDFKIHLFYFLYALMAANAVGNPLVTILTQRQYTQKFKEILGKLTKSQFVPSFSRASVMTTFTVSSTVESRKASLEL